MKLDASDIAELEPVIVLAVRKALDMIRGEQHDGGKVAHREGPAAELLDVEQHVLAAARRRGAIKAKKIGRYFVYSHAELLRFAGGLPAK